jgi:hypothetical protein
VDVEHIEEVTVRLNRYAVSCSLVLALQLLSFVVEENILVAGSEVSVIVAVRSLASCDGDEGVWSVVRYMRSRRTASVSLMRLETSSLLKLSDFEEDDPGTLHRTMK